MYDQRKNEEMAVLSLRNKIAQMLLVGFAGTEISANSPIYRWIHNEGIGGVILFDYDVQAKASGKNLKDIQQIKRLTKDLKEAALSSNNAIELLVAVDFEGGAVDRFRSVPGTILTHSPAELALLPEQERKACIVAMARQCSELGFNLNFAPVVDLNRNEAGIIGALQRCFSPNAELVAARAHEFATIFAEFGVQCCYKHFPGHGSASGDTHAEFVDVTNSFSTDELIPYESNPCPAPMIMTAHVINRQLDPSGLPATLSYKILTELLRQKLAYKGVVISDDLQMHALSQYYSLQEILIKTINAGADMLIVANQLATISAEQLIDTIENLVHNQLIAEARIEQAFERIQNFKKFYSTAALCTS